jgi:molybdenum cofactor cytidylyltransferase
VGERVLIAILAAGGSRRLGRPKQLVDIGGGGGGEPLLRRQCRVAIESAVAPVAVILGSRADACAATIAGLAVTVRVNPEWEEGLASSLREAARAAVDGGAAGLLLLLGDQYRVAAGDLRALHAAWTAAGAGKVCRARHQDYAGPPVLFPAALFPNLMRLRGDAGARQVVSMLGTDALVDVPIPNAVHDLDVPAQLAQAWPS